MSKILLIEDSKTHVRYIQMALEEEYQIAAVSQGKEGYLQAITFQPDLILLDLNLPDVDGIKVLKRLKKDPNTAQIPVIVITSRSKGKDQEDAFQIGADEYLIKPFDVRELQVRIGNLLKMIDIERKLEHWMEVCETYFNMADDCILILDQEQRIEYMNLVAKQKLGYTDQILGKTFQSLLVRISGEANSASLDQLVEKDYVKFGLASGGIGYYQIQSMEMNSEIGWRKRLIFLKNQLLKVMDYKNERLKEFFLQNNLGEKDLKSFMATNLEQIREELEISMAVLYLFDVQNCFVTIHGQPFSIYPLHQVPGECLHEIAQRVREQRVRMVDSRDTFCQGCTSCFIEQNPEIRLDSIVSLPIYNDEQVMGVLQLVIANEQTWIQAGLERLDLLVENLGFAIVKKRLQHELQQNHQRLMENIERARLIQQSILPESLPDTLSTEFGAVTIPSFKVSGDSYDCFSLREGCWGFYLADVSGHGVDAAMLSIFVKTRISTLILEKGDDPVGILTEVHQAYIAQNFPKDMFISLLYGIYDEETGIVRLSSAGFGTTPFYLNQKGELEYLTCRGTLINQLFTTPIFKEQIIQLKPGESLLFFTDGLVEVSDQNGQMAGKERVAEIYQQCSHLPNALIFKELVQQLRSFGNGYFNDDLTLFRIYHKPFPYELIEQERGFLVKVYENRLQHLSFIVKTVIELVKYKTLLSKPAQHHFVLNELIANKMEHGNLEIDICRFDADYEELVREREENLNLLQRKLEIQVVIADEWVTYMIEDEGVGFVVQKFNDKQMPKGSVKGLPLVATQVEVLAFSPSGNRVKVKLVN